METKTHTVLSGMPRKNAFVVPEGYFEELPTAVLLKCSVSKVKRTSIMMYRPLWRSVAASIVLLLGIWFVVPDTTSPLESSYVQNENIHSTQDDLNDYLSDHACPILIEDELYASNANLTNLSGYFNNEDFSTFGDEITAYIDYTSIFDLY